MSNLSQINRIIGGILLVSGTAVGAGMLGFPLAMAKGGWNGALVFFLFTWLVMTFTALLMLEVALLFPQEVNFISMTKKTLGRAGSWVAWLIYVGFFYALMTAYTSGGASIFRGLLEQSFGISLSPVQSVIFFVSFFSMILWIGTSWIDWCNRLLMLGLVGAYLVLVFSAIPHINPAHFIEGDIHQLWGALPLLVAAFGFHLLIPSLKSYLNHDAKALRIAIWGGSFLSLVIYVLWQYVIFGLFDQQTLIHMEEAGQPVSQLTDTLKALLNHPWIFWSIQLFGLFALLSSFLGVALSVFDFFADGFHLAKKGASRLLLVLLTLGLPGIFSWLNPTGFLKALNYGGIFAAVLLILFPVAMVWRARLLQQASYVVPGGKGALALAAAFGILVIISRVLSGVS